MAQFDDFLGAVRSGAADLAETTVHGFANQARLDVEAFLTASRTDLTLWAGQMARGELAAWEFEDLVKGQSELAQLAALAQAGIALTALERFRTGLIDLVIKSATDTFL